MLFGGLAVVAEAILRDRTRGLYAFAAVYFVSLVGELLGTTYGIPFGEYSYIALLGVKWFDRVPLLIPLSWFTICWACWVIARQRSAGLSAILFGTALLVAWNLLLDPAMSKVTSYWILGERDSYYGMPWMNLVGWCLPVWWYSSFWLNCAGSAQRGEGCHLGIYHQFPVATRILSVEPVSVGR
jgi:uncharacterized membrane protein